jgi:uncharacterized membrane protein
MRIVLAVIGAVVAMSGFVWFLQGIGVLPGSMMSGQTQWAIYGALAMAGGIALVVWSRRRSAK